MAIPRFRSMLRWIKWDKSNCAVAAMGTACIIFFLSLFLDSTPNSRLSVDSLFNSSSNSDLVKLTLSSKAKERGAFCLDGSLPGYHFQKGFGSGSDKWVLHIEGGGWCNTVESCKSRAMTKLGSSKYFEQEVPFGGILSRDPSQNPDFYNWNRVKIRYCDGASFAGHPEAELKNETMLFFRGQLIWEAIMDDLLSRGMSGAKQAFLTGCSAGGLATLIHCDYFKDHFPKDVTVKCLADAGFFLDELDIRKNPTMKSFYHDVVHLQSVAKSLEKNCVAKTEPSNCMFPKEFIKNIKTPVFIVNPAYDFWQIQNILVPSTTDPNRHWGRCRLNIKDCDATQIEILHEFRRSLVDAVEEFQQKKENGMFINSCFVHCQTWMSETWHSSTSPRIKNKTIAEAVGDWYFNRESVKLMDCPYPCNPTCFNLDFTLS